MQKSATRPVFLNLLQIHMPIGAVVSILHRATGAVLALLIPFALWALHGSLASEARFEQVRAMLSSGLGRAALLLALWILVQHLYSGIRHLLLDVDVGIDLPAARRGAWLTLVASIATVAALSFLL